MAKRSADSDRVDSGASGDHGKRRKLEEKEHVRIFHIRFRSLDGFMFEICQDLKNVTWKKI